MMKHKTMMLRRTVPDRLEAGRWIYRKEEFEVIVLAIVDNHAMVRRKGCAPFVESAKRLFQVVPKNV
jgi:hypothetical protein